MSDTKIGIYQLPYDYLFCGFSLSLIYDDSETNYYWSKDFSASYYIAQAKAGFIAIMDTVCDEQVLLPEIGFSYSILDFENLHISKKVAKLIKNKQLTITIDDNLEEIREYIAKTHKRCWVEKRYISILRETQNIKDSNFRVITVYIEYNGEIVAGEIGYIIGKTYTSLSGFSNKEYNSFGIAQMVLLGKKLQKAGFDFWNLGQPYMAYKNQLGAKDYDRIDFLERWYQSIDKEEPII